MCCETAFSEEDPHVMGNPVKLEYHFCKRSKCFAASKFHFQTPH
jgi:hypothetical protein